MSGFKIFAFSLTFSDWKHYFIVKYCIICIVNYSKCLELTLSDIPTSSENKDLEGIVLGIFKKLVAKVDLPNVEDYHSSKGQKKLFWNFLAAKTATKYIHWKRFEGY